MQDTAPRHPLLEPDPTGVPPDAIRVAYDAVTKSLTALAAFEDRHYDTDAASQCIRELVGTVDALLQSQFELLGAIQLCEARLLAIDDKLAPDGNWSSLNSALPGIGERSH